MKRKIDMFVFQNLQ